jgi:hypothetical protein
MSLGSRLMTRFGVPDALIGDIVEGRPRHSRLWLLREILAATLHAAASAVIHDPAAALRAGILSVGMTVGWYECALHVYLWVSASSLIQESSAHSLLFLFMWQIYALPLNLVWCVGALMTGWIVVRLSQINRPPLALLVAVAELPLALWWGVTLVVRLHAVWLQNPLPTRFAAGWIFQSAVVLIGMPLCILVGGMAAQRHQRSNVSSVE